MDHLKPEDGGSDGPGEDATILFVDGDPFEALVFTAALEGRYMEVRRAPSAGEALNLMEDPAKASRVDLVIFSHNQAGISDSDFIAEVHRRKNSVRILVLGAEEDCVQDYPATCALVVYMSKPITVERLAETANRIVHRTFRNWQDWMTVSGKS